MIAGLLLLLVGGEGLVRGSTELARRLGVSRLVIGLTIVSFGTSSPELVVSIKAALAGNGGIALGNVVGSNVANIALILGLSALIRPLPVDRQVIRWDMPVFIGSSLLMSVFFLDRMLARWEAIVLVSAMTAYMILSVLLGRRAARLARSELDAAGTKPAEPASSGKGEQPARQRLSVVIGMVLVGLGLLPLGAHLLVEGAVTFAVSMGVPTAVIGLTIVAVGTSLPELAASAVAAYKGEVDLAVGNVVGSNIFNTLGILGCSGAIEPFGAQGVGAVDVGVMLVISVLVIPIMLTGRRVNRYEGGFLLSTYLGYIAYIIIRTVL